MQSKRLLDGDILLEGSGGGPGKPVGRVARFDATAHIVPAICSNFFKTLRPDPKVVDPRYLFRKLQWLYEQPELLALQQQTTGIINLKFAEYLQTVVCLPSDLEEQARIAEILDTVDTTIRQTEAIVAKLKQVKQGLLHDLLTRGVDANGELRPPSSHSPSLYKNSSLGLIPKAWTVESLGKHAEIAGGITLGRTVSGAGTVELPYLRVANVQDGYLDLSRVSTIRISANELPRYRLEHGDVLMNEGGDYDKLGRGVVWSGEIDSCLHQNHVFRVRCNPSSLHPHFLSLYSASTFGKRYFVQASKQTTNLASINSTQLKAFPIRMPSADEQRAIIEKVEGINSRLRAELEGLKKQMTLKSGLMDDLLTGRVRVTPLLST